MRAKQFSVRDFSKVLRNNGYWIKRKPSSSHIIWTNSENKTLVISTCKVNKMLARRLIKEYDLVV